MRTPEELMESADKHLLEAERMPPGEAAATKAHIAAAEVALAQALPQRLPSPPPPPEWMKPQ